MLELNLHSSLELPGVQTCLRRANLEDYTDTRMLYENIDQTLLSKLHGQMHYKLGVTCVYNGHVFYTLV